MKKANSPFTIAGITISPGRKKDIQVKIGEMYTASPIFVPVTVVNGAFEGPVLFVTAAIHGNELNGIETVRILRGLIQPETLAGTLLLVAIANPVSFVTQMRELPDGRDMNRAFPGSPRGTMASQLAHSLFHKIIRKANYGIDLHTAANGRTNLPHVRGDMTIPEVKRMAKAFGADVVFDLPGEKKTLRSSACKAGIPTIVYEAGEPMKFQTDLVEKGVLGISNTMRELGMIDGHTPRKKHQIIVKNHQWIRSKSGGILALDVHPGEVVHKGDLIGRVTRPFGTDVKNVRAGFTGVVVGAITIPMVLPGSAVCHVLRLKKRDIRKVQRWKHTQWSED